MERYIIDRLVGPSALTIEHCEDLAPAPGGVVVDVRAIGINFPDLLMVSGRYQSLPPLPFTPGMEASGVVRAVDPGVEGLNVGDRVIVQVLHGTFAQQVSVPAHCVFPIPAEMDFEGAAALGLAYQTACFALVERGKVEPGETVLIGAASGGIGLAAVQLAKVMGATVVAGVRSAEAGELARSYGADHVVDLSGPNLADRLREDVRAATGGRGIDLILDPVGGEFFTAALRTLNWCGRLVVIGFVAGSIPSVRANYLLVKNISISGLQWSDYRDRRPDKVMAVHQEMVRLWEGGHIRPHIMEVFPFAELPEALVRADAGGVRGKIVVSLVGAVDDRA